MMQWVRNLCRLCGEIGEVCYHLFEPNLRLHLKVKRCLNLEIAEDDYKPKEICGLCHNKVHEFLQFIDTTLATNMKFESMYFSNGYYVNDKLQYPMTPYADNNYKQSVIVTNHHQPNKPMIENGDAIPYIEYDNDSIQPNIVNLFDCADKSMVQNDFVSYNNAPTNPVSVEEIKKSVPTRPKRKKLQSYSCPHCNKTFLRRLNLTAHVAKHTNIKNFQCPSCPKSFAVKTLLTQHKKVHSELHKCQLCHKGFQSPSKLSRHMSTHEANKPFTCPIESCRKGFSDKGNLNQHIKSHATEKTLRCRLCDRLFKTERHLKAHVKNHTRDSKFVCVCCDKGFKYKHNLQVHSVKRHNKK